MLHRAYGDLHRKRVPAGSAVTLENFRGIFDDCGDLRKNVSDDAHANQRQYRQPHLRCADLGVVAQNDSGVFELADPLDDCWRRQSNAAREFGEAEAAMLLQVMEELAVDSINGEFSL